jgi:hypothetical protein
VRRDEPEGMHNSRRNYLHVRRADAVYAIGYRMLPDGSTPSLDIAGGTGVACTFYLDRFQHGGEDASSCQLYFFDEGGEAFDEGTFATDSATLHRWSKWDPIRERWQPMRTLPPLPSGLYAGIGASKLGPRARKAVQELSMRKPQGLQRVTTWSTCGLPSLASSRSPPACGAAKAVLRAAVIITQPACARGARVGELGHAHNRSNGDMTGTGTTMRQATHIWACRQCDLVVTDLVVTGPAGPAAGARGVNPPRCVDQRTAAADAGTVRHVHVSDGYGGTRPRARFAKGTRHTARPAVGRVRVRVYCERQREAERAGAEGGGAQLR